MGGGIVMNKTRLLGAVCAGLLSITANPVLAAVVYGYTGNQFDEFPAGTAYDTSNFISGTVTLENLLVANTTSTPAILDFSFTDGNQTLSMANGAAILDMEFTTDENGITNWKVELKILPPTPLEVDDTSHILKTLNWESGVQDTGIIQTFTNIMPFGPAWSQDIGKVLDSAGSWEGDVASVPLPATAWLFGSGLVALFGIAKRKK